MPLWSVLGSKSLAWRRVGVTLRSVFSTHSTCFSTFLRPLILPTWRSSLELYQWCSTLLSCLLMATSPSPMCLDTLTLAVRYKSVVITISFSYFTFQLSHLQSLCRLCTFWIKSVLWRMRCFWGLSSKALISLRRSSLYVWAHVSPSESFFSLCLDLLSKCAYMILFVAGYQAVAWCCWDYVRSAAGEGHWYWAHRHHSRSVQKWEWHPPQVDLSFWCLAIPGDIHWGIQIIWLDVLYTA